MESVHTVTTLEDDEPIDVNHLTHQLARVEHLMEQRLDHALDQVGLTLRQFTVLAHVGRTPGLSRTDVARQLLITPQAVGALVQRLMMAGLIQRAASSPGLPIGLTLTPAGEQTLHRAAPIARDAENTAVAAVAEDERRRVAAVLDQLITELSR